MVIKQGIYNATDGDEQSELYKELLKHAIFEYTKVWLAQAKEEDSDFNMATEKKAAYDTFMKYYEESA